ncbi:hypothetical protein K2173_010703 [Erythroxylum novogranatense]|uniref:START domain-containing protein n=1 Tax=Erythroxylum novogranatense TaxID=1862640 RepID=A0AAV8SQP5_9ROSI|nr:hypothetical protein K2173_010703 [Erythroxylum novogranatense]
MPRSRRSRRTQDQRRRNIKDDETIFNKINDPASSQSDGAVPGGRIGAVNNVVEGAAKSVDQMEISEALGLEREIIPQSPPHSHHSVVDSVSSSNIPLEIDRATDLLIAVSVAAEEHRNKVRELAVSAMSEFVKKALAGEPLWQVQVDTGVEALNEDEYLREFRALDVSLEEIMKMIIQMDVPDPFPRNVDVNNEVTSRFYKDKLPLPRETHRDYLSTESSREVGFVTVSPTNLVEWFMDVKQWSSLFANIVSKVTKLGELSTGVAGTYDGMLLVMRAEFHMPTPLVPIRECQFARYCKQVGLKAWGIVDVSLDNLFQYPVTRFRRMPSGCLIQELPNGHSKVTWVEHAEVDNSLVHRLFRPLVCSGFAFSAKRWFGTLIRQCKRIGAFIHGNVHRANGFQLEQIGKEGLLRLAERMTRSFVSNVSASTENQWKLSGIDGVEDCRLMNKIVPLCPGGSMSTIAFSSSLWISVSPKKVFDFVIHMDCRNKWDILNREYVTQEYVHIMTGDNPEHRVSIIGVNSAQKTEIMYLQECYSDEMGYYFVYAPMDLPAVSIVASGGNPDSMNILPSGFVIHPDKPPMEGQQPNGCILTMAFHIALASDLCDGKWPKPSEVSEVAYGILKQTGFSITRAVLSGDV